MEDKKWLIQCEESSRHPRIKFGGNGKFNVRNVGGSILLGEVW
jgi:hypothetical protein